MAKMVATGLLLGFASAAQLKANQGCGTMTMNRGRVHAKSHAHVGNPGAGIGLEDFVPFEKSYNDGYMMIDCIKDEMHEFGDKFGDGKFSYNLGAKSNVSIMHYTDVIPAEDQEAMTHEVCFSFCRSMPNMGFFGITNGRDCYCEPYYRQSPGDSSSCDAVCDGDAATMCGGKSKSSIFSLHACNDHQANLVSATESCESTREEMGSLSDAVLGLATAMQAAADALQPELGNVGDSVAAGHLQQAKVFAGELQHSADAAKVLQTDMEELETESGGHDVAGPVPATEKLTTDLQARVERAKDKIKELKELKNQANTSGDASNLYYNVMYFVDKEFVDAPTTCGGKAVGEPIVGSAGGCAAACEATAGACVGFSYFAKEDSGLCFLLSELDTAVYYTGCDSAATDTPAEGASFLAKKDIHDVEDADYDAEEPASPTGHYCGVKFANFMGTTLAPDPSGKCKACLKEAKKADRCPYPA